MTTDDSAAPDEKRLRLRYAGICHLCGAQLPAGEPAVYERAARRVRCIACPTSGEPPRDSQTLSNADPEIAVPANVRDVDDDAASHELENDLFGLHSVVDPATARAAQATENVWREIANEFGLLESSEVSALLGASKGNLEFVSIRRNSGELLGVVRNNGYLYPGFQFDRSTGTIREWVRPLLELAREHRMGAGDVLFWMMSPTTYFGGDRPADHMNDGDQLLDIARRSWSVEV